MHEYISSIHISSKRAQDALCGHCDAVLDRDYNAVNIFLAGGISERLNACGGDVRALALVADASLSEAGTRQETPALSSV